jgi:hypothetical protein
MVERAGILSVAMAWCSVVCNAVACFTEERITSSCGGIEERGESANQEDVQLDSRVGSEGSEVELWC